MNGSGSKRYDKGEERIYSKKANVTRLLSYFIPYIPHIAIAVIMHFQ